ncbi:hypothetical protein [Rhodobacter sp. TJ_12]|uniref:hypothetical protein n=1 Tax=Rhodobacter sp. TJ_12 TaxID=2029399 RepID=UPI001CBF8030|nr:hypothetical protein [Rhodobacter sp. TJ_12]
MVYLRRILYSFSAKIHGGLDKLAEAILKAAGFRVELSTSKTVENKFKLVAKFGLPAFGGAGSEVECKGSLTKTDVSLEIDPSDPNDLVGALEKVGFESFIVLEDFHYLPKETQKKYSFFLKTVHERSNICFIIVAVWREENRLILFNGDLSGRVVSVDADAWSEKELEAVISKGEDLLNIDFGADFRRDLIKASLGSVYIVQEACRRACNDANVVRTESFKANLKLKRSANEYVAEVVGESAPRYRNFLTRFADGFQDTNLEMYKWLLYPIVTAPVEQLEQGLRYRYIKEQLMAVHPRGSDLNPGNVTQALISVPALQSKKNIKPFVLDYDQSDLKLSVVDKGFLIWLSTADVSEILDFLDLSPFPKKRP